MTTYPAVEQLSFTFEEPTNDQAESCTRCHKLGLFSSYHEWAGGKRICFECFLQVIVTEPSPYMAKPKNDQEVAL